MLKATRYKLHFGPYATPRFKYGQRVDDETRGEVVIVGLSNAKIAWPLGKIAGSRKPGLVIFKGLAKALRLESATAICHWWGVTGQTVSKWRGLLGIERGSIPGETLLRKQAVHEPYFKRFRKAGLATANVPERNAKISASMQGKPRSRHVIEAMRKGRTGKPQSVETRTKISASHKQRRTRPPAAGKTWTKKEHRLSMALRPTETANLTGRSLHAVMSHRRNLVRARVKIKRFRS